VFEDTKADSILLKIKEEHMSDAPLISACFCRELPLSFWQIARFELSGVLTHPRAEEECQDVVLVGGTSDVDVPVHVVCVQGASGEGE